VKIEQEHLYHGAALIQIAEDSRFTAINSLGVGTDISKSAYRINDDIGVYLKYAGKPNTSHSEYVFNFSMVNRQEMATLSGSVSRFFVVLVCVKGREICCLEYRDVESMFRRRREAKHSDEEQITILVTMPKGKKFRVYVNAPRKKNRRLGKAKLVTRNDFPSVIFP
jgi:hypothetical protein